jgi:AbrB family looped-hinge helix DNA binding protein
MAETVTAKLSIKSQTVIPKPVRDKLGVGPGDLVEFEIREVEVPIRRLQRPSGSIRSPCFMSGKVRSTRTPSPIFEAFTTISVPFPYIQRASIKRSAGAGPCRRRS